MITSSIYDIVLQNHHNITSSNNTYLTNTKNYFLMENMCNSDICSLNKAKFLSSKNIKNVQIYLFDLKTFMKHNILFFRNIYSLSLRFCKKINLNYVRNVPYLFTSMCDEIFSNNNIAMNNFNYIYFYSCHDDNSNYLNLQMLINFKIFTNICNLTLSNFDINHKKFTISVFNNKILTLQNFNNNNDNKNNSQKQIIFKHINKIYINYT